MKIRIGTHDVNVHKVTWQKRKPLNNALGIIDIHTFLRSDLSSIVLLVLLLLQFDKIITQNTYTVHDEK